MHSQKVMKISSLVEVTLLFGLVAGSQKAFNAECTLSSECREDHSLVCLTGRCRCYVFSYYDPDHGCLQGLLENRTASIYGGYAGPYLGCRSDLGLTPKDGKCSCYPSRWSSEQSMCIAQSQCLDRSLTRATRTADSCYEYLKFGTEYVFTEQDVHERIMSTVDSADYVCQSHIEDAIKCIDNIIKNCPASVEKLKEDRKDGLPPLYDVYSDFRTWSKKNCDTVNFARFESSRECVDRALESESFKTCWRELPKVDTQTREYACGITDAAKSCFQSSIGDQCNKEAADVAFSIVELFILKQEDCPTATASCYKSCYNVMIVLLLLTVIRNVIL